MGKRVREEGGGILNKRGGRILAVRGEKMHYWEKSGGGFGLWTGEEKISTGEQWWF